MTTRHLRTVILSIVAFLALTACSGADVADTPATGSEVGTPEDGAAEEPTEAIGQRAVDKLSEAESADIDGNDKLLMIFDAHAEVGADPPERGQHDVDAQCVHRHQRRHQRHEFPEMETVRAVFGGWGR